MQAEIKTCKNCNQNFTITVDDFSFYEKIKVPPPTFCPECRYQRRIAGRNEWVLYSRTCSRCSEKMVSIYNPNYDGKVYCLKCFWSDDWDRKETGMDFDFSRPFFEQFQELRNKTPKVTVAHFRSINSPYTNQSQDLKNCYFIFSSDASEDCMYGNWFFTCKQSVDCSIVYGSELIYECLDTSRCFKSTYLKDCRNCLNSHFLEDCYDCQNCFGCVGLRNKSYYFFNQKLTKEEYEKRMSEFEWTVESIEKTNNKLKELALQLPRKFYKGRSNVNSTGNYIYHLKNVRFAFNSHRLEDVSYSQDVSTMNGGRDITEAAYNELDYEIEGVGYSARSIAVSRSWNVYDCLYSFNCFSCDSCFGCVSLNKNKYCILNKQYSKEDYEVLKEKIIKHMKKTGEWGNFFPISISLFAYNETIAQEYFPISKEKVIAKGWRWYERDNRHYKVTLRSNDLPETIKETNDTILEETISCVSHETGNDMENYFNCTTAFRVTTDELNFYRRMNLPIPHKCFMCRLQDRLHLRTPRKLWHRSCMCNKTNHFHGQGKCDVEFETSYAPEQPEMVYCEKCYQAEIY